MGIGFCTECGKGSEEKAKENLRGYDRYDV